MSDLTDLLHNPAETVHEGGAALQALVELLSCAAPGAGLGNVSPDNLGYLLRLVGARLELAESQTQAQHDELLALRFPQPSRKPLG